MAAIRRSQIVSPNLIKQRVYSDITSEFVIHPNKKDVVLNENEDAVKESIRNILRTRRGERFYNPSFGSDIYSILFENFTPQTEVQLRNYIETSIDNFEPRAKLISVDLTPYPDENGYSISIVFSVINRTDPVQLELLLNRIR